MRANKFITIDENILLEYIYDDDNLVGEPYNIITNTVNRLRCFISADEMNPPRRGFKQTNNTLYNQLYKIDETSGRYGKVPKLSSQANAIDTEKSSFLQIQNYPTSPPIRYDKIKVHLPVDYTFGEYKGFHLRVYTYDFNDKFQYELSNYYFDMTDVEQNYRLEYSSPLLYQNEKSWGKYLEIQIPSVTKISDQRVQNVTKENTINWNLTRGVGISKNAPVFIEFQFISSIDTVNKQKFFNLFDKKTVVVPQTPDFENLGVTIEESAQGDFFLIYGTYNGTLAEFENYIEESYYYGNKYYVEFTVETYEKNVKTKTNTFVLLEDFGEEIEFRPILKFTTTTAVIDVTMKVIDITDNSIIERKASFGLLQGGGQRMGSDPNERLGIGNKSGGAGDIAKYAKKLSKINLKGSKKTQVTSLKQIMLSTTGDDPFGTRPILELKKVPFSLFSNSDLFATIGNEPIVFDKVQYNTPNSTIVYIYPFDNFLPFKILLADDFEETPYDLSALDELKLTIKSDKKDLDFSIYRESSYNDLENGKVVFKVPQGQYQDIKKISNQGFDLFYVNGMDQDGNKVIVYSSFFLPWDSVTNIQQLENKYNLDQTAPDEQKTREQGKDIIAEVRDVIISDSNKPKGVNTATTNQTSKSSGTSAASFNFKPRWIADDQSVLIGNSNKNYKKVNPTKALTQTMLSLDITTKETLSKVVELKNKKSKGLAEDVSATKSNNNQLRYQLVVGYFKGLNLELTADSLLEYWRNDRFKVDLLNYVYSGESNQKTAAGIGLVESEVKIGEFIPIDKSQIEKIKNNQIYEALPKIQDLKNQIAQQSNKLQNAQDPPQSSNPLGTSGQSGVSYNTYNPNQNIPRGGKG